MNSLLSHRGVLGAAIFVSLAFSPPTFGQNAAPSLEWPAVAEAMSRIVADGRIAGAVTLARRQGRIVHHQAHGRLRLDSESPMTRDALFQIASMTKPITATAFLMLVDEGVVSVDDPVADVLPEFADVRWTDGAAATTLTFRHLLTHTSGLQNPEGLSFFNGASLADFSQQAAAVPLAFPPGERWSYGNGLHVVGRAIEVLSGSSYAEFLEERIFQPLAMNDATFEPNDRQRTRLAGMIAPDDSGAATARPTPGLATDESPVTPNPSGGLFCTAEDISRFYQMVLDDGRWGDEPLVSSAAVRAMTTLQTGDLETGFTPGNGWGLGWCVVREPQGVSAMLHPGAFGHGGAWGTQGWIDPADKTIYVLMIQRSGFGNSDGSEIRETFQRIVADELADR